MSLGFELSLSTPRVRRGWAAGLAVFGLVSLGVWLLSPWPARWDDPNPRTALWALTCLGLFAAALARRRGRRPAAAPQPPDPSLRVDARGLAWLRGSDGVEQPLELLRVYQSSGVLALTVRLHGRTLTLLSDRRVADDAVWARVAAWLWWLQRGGTPEPVLGQSLTTGT